MRRSSEAESKNTADDEAKLKKAEDDKVNKADLPSQDASLVAIMPYKIL